MPLFVIQKHDARNLHYDFRLEVDGVLKSWAVPKGPSMDPAEKRLAVYTEDHAMAHADFEGIIAEGEYGAGSVIVWDRGTYDNVREEKENKSMAASMDSGKIEIQLEGKKLRGGFVLFRTGKGGAKNWLLKKVKDPLARPGSSILEEAPQSVISGRTIEEMRGGESR